MANRRSFGRFLLSALCTSLLAVSGTAAEHGIATAQTATVAMLVHHPEVRKQRATRWKPFLPALPAAIFFPSRHPDPEMNQSEPCIPDLPDMALELREQRAIFSTGAEPGFRSFKEEPLPTISRNPDNRISLKDEMITLGDLDIGKTGGMVRWEDRTEKKLEGFLQIPTIWVEDMVRPYMVNMNVPERSDPSQAGAAIGLAEAVNRHTGISAAAGPHLFLGSPRIFEMPFLFLGADRSFELTGTERLNLGDYLRTGGFIFLDNSAPATEWGPGEASLKLIVRDALGADARFLPIPRSHPLYHCFFEFTDGPPNGIEIDGFNWSPILTSGTNYTHVKMTGQVSNLEGVFLDGELVALFSNKGYTQKWNRRLSDNIPQLKMGVNLVVYALTRERGMNRRNMEWFRNDGEE